MLNLLGLETSTEACSVALMDAKGNLFSEFKITPRQHTKYLPLMLDAVLQQAGVQRHELSHISYASGPGAFTGVRIAASTAQGIAIALGVKLVPVSTLAVLAQQAVDLHACEEMQVALDARMGEAYYAVYKKDQQSGLVELEGEEQLIKLDQLLPKSGMYCIGSGFRARHEAGFSDQNHPNIMEDIYPTAAALVKLASEVVKQKQVYSADKAVINYIRNQVAEKKAAAL